MLMIHLNPPPASKPMATNEKNIINRPENRDDSPALALKNCFFFAALLFRYPDDRIYSAIRQNLAAFSDFFLAYGDRVPRLPSSEDLQAEYIGLFVNNKGFVPAVPYASCHIDGGRLMGDSFVNLRQKMAETGFVMDPSVPELEDHLTVLLEYTSSLIGLIAGSDGGQAETAGVMETLRVITGDYIRPLVESMADRINEYATMDFYRIAIHTLREFIRESASIYETVLDVGNKTEDE